MKQLLPLIFILLSFSLSSLQAQDLGSNLWTPSSNTSSARLIEAEKQQTFKLAFGDLNNALLQNSNHTMAIPYPDGSFKNFSLEESSVMSAALAAKFPEIKTFIGENKKTGEIVRLDVSKKGFHAMIYSNEGVFFIDPIEKNNISDYQVYFKKDLFKETKKAAFPESEPIIFDKDQYKRIQSRVASGNVQRPSGTQLRTYRIAVVATGEYTQYHGGTVQDALSAIVTTMNRVNGIFEKEMAVRMELVGNNDQLIFTDGATDPFNNEDNGVLIEQVQVEINTRIGLENYDIGHGFSTIPGGLAGLGVVCNDSGKGFGVTGLTNPIGDPFDVDYVSHEIGHQFGAPHSFNGTVGGCSNRSSNSAYEPGSGTTIMAYAGICGSDNIQQRSDAYFHAGSLEFMNGYMQDGTGNSCAQITETGNSLPVVNAGQGGFSIPINTPFQLNGSATDPNGDNLTYTWEQFDLGEAGSPNAPVGSAPLFRSFSPSQDSFRIFPQRSDIINQTQTIGEILPSYARNLNFRLTVRDNQAISGVNYDDISFSVTDAAGPFTVEPVNGNYNGLNTINVNWNVNNTDIAPVNAQFVDIYVSLDGGQTFTEKVLENTPNDGTEPIKLPNVNTSQAKIKIAASNSVFFNMSPSVFSITETTEPSYVITVSSEVNEYCPNDEITFSIETESILGFNEGIVLSTAGLEQFNVNFDNQVLTPGSSTTLRISNVNQVSGQVDFIVNSNTSNISFNSNAVFTVNKFAETPTITFPSNGAVDLNLQPTFIWTDNNVTADYRLEIATDNNFTNIIETNQVVNNKESKLNNQLEGNSTYYARLIAENICGQSAYTPTLTFSTANIICDNFVSTDVPLEIPVTISTVESTINVPYSGAIESMSVQNLIGTHSWISDLTVRLQSPAGTQITLFSNICGATQNFNLALSDDGLSSSSIACPATDGQTYQPQTPFSTFNGEDAQGEWKLIIEDRVTADGGQLDSWGLDFCLADVVGPEIIAPSNILASEDRIGTIALNWTDNSTSETGFVIERSDVDNPNFREVGRVGANVTAYEDNTILEEKEYTYRVKAILDIFSSNYSNLVSILTQPQVPAAPSTIIASNLSNNNVLIQWSDNNDIEFGYFLERSVNDNLDYDTIAGLGQNSFSYTDDEVDPKTTYYYRVRGFNQNGIGAFSEEAMIETLEAFPMAPSNLRSTIENDTIVNLSWSDNSENELSFTLQRATENGNFITIENLPANSDTFEEVLNPGTYRYRVAARNSRGLSDYSNVETFTIINLDEDGSVLGVNQKWDSELKLYPNPTKNVVFLKNESQLKINRIEIRNALGQRISGMKNILSDEEIEIPLDNLSSGMYFIHIQSAEAFVIKQLIIE
ncbi:reprolysin-like metallopeptidase [Marivirga sp.]|uniref:reprolysin-like metallopeptidase n=1 Tax=Marivirga sp. TaxID=2018662 RepID=UPI002D7FE773|nr:zinc-dependent metalloprotease family protein [Marivirga sp.]HET8858992.1 zinc-dependent metalloprotease family protein [Marivirga sp.]